MKFFIVVVEIIITLPPGEEIRKKQQLDYYLVQYNMCQW